MKMRVESHIERTCNRIMMIILLLILVLSPLSFGGVSTLHLYIFHLGIIVLTVLWGIKMVAARNVKLLKTPIYIPILLFTAYLIFHVYQSDILYYARIELIKTIDYGLLFIIFINNFYRKKYVYTVLLALMLVGVVLASLGLIHYFKKTKIVYGVGLKQELVQTVDGEQAQTFAGVLVREKPVQYENRASGTFVCPNHLAGYLELIFPFALGICLLSHLVMGARLFIGYAFIVMLSGWILTFSRGGWLGGVAAFICFIILALLRDDHRGNSWILPIIVVALSLTLIAIFVKPVQDRVLSITPTEGSAACRLNIWKDTVSLIKKAPLWGHGPSSFRWLYPSVRYRELVRKVTYTHNDYLNTIHDLGAFGLILVLLFCGMLFIQVRKIPLFFDRRDQQVILICSLSTLVAVMVHAVFDFNNQIYSNALLLMVVAGIIIVSSRNFESEQDQFIRFIEINRNLFLRALVAVIFITAGGIGFVHGSKLFLAELNFHKGELLKDAVLWDKAEKNFLTSAHLDPINPEVYANLGDILNAKSLFRKENAGDAIKLYDIALRYNPYESDFLFKKALLLKRNKQFESAYKAVKDAIALEPHHAVFISEYRKLEKLLNQKP
ncbi:O-antigen ligase family protein [bacterium]|nr:O-antigen ligase family protein [bacterium]